MYRRQVVRQGSFTQDFRGAAQPGLQEIFHCFHVMFSFGFDFF